MKKQKINPILNDRMTFIRIMERAGIMMFKSMGDEYQFLNEEALQMYDNLSHIYLHWFSQKTLDSPAFKMSILQLMGVIASQEPNFHGALKKGLGENVVDFLKYKEYRDTDRKKLTCGTAAR